MKLQIASDLHTEFEGPVPLDDVGADVLILAGDIGYADSETVLWLNSMRKRYSSRILYVPGNHEYYGQDFDAANRYMDRISVFGGFIWMNNFVWEYEGQRFVGTPLWTNFRNDPVARYGAGRMINDFRRILYGDGVMTPEAMHSLYDEAMAFLKDEVQEGDVVITHFPPSNECRHKGFPEGNDVAKYFTNEISEFILEREPCIWVSGHVHYNFDFMIGNTRVVSNQAGYPNEHVRGWDPAFTVEI